MQKDVDPECGNWLAHQLFDESRAASTTVSFSCTHWSNLDSLKVSLSLQSKMHTVELAI
jgi:hypothetical protein